MVSRHSGTLDDLPADATVATNSPRRRAQLTARWPHLQVTAVRGNTNTRMRKLDQGEYDAMILTVAGLRRIGQTARITQVLPVKEMLPTVGAGTIVVTTRTRRHRDDPPRRLPERPGHRAGGHRRTRHAPRAHRPLPQPDRRARPGRVEQGTTGRCRLQP